MKEKILIGITASFHENKENLPLSQNIVGRDYVLSIIAAGAIPIVVPVIQEKKLIEEYADFLTVGSNLQIIKNKINRFKTSSHLMQQELVKVNQAIINHFITINALEMARDDLLPLINAELAIGKGRNTENQSLQITQNVFDLFQSLLTRNAEAAEQNMQLLQKSTLSNEIISVLSQDIETYLNGLNQARQVTQIDSPLTLSLEENEQKNLTKKGQ